MPIYMLDVHGVTLSWHEYRTTSALFVENSTATRNSVSTVSAIGNYFVSVHASSCVKVTN